MTKPLTNSPTGVFPDLLTGNWNKLAFEPFRPGIEICELLSNGGDEAKPSMALLRYAPGATVPPHRHHGVETILVLEGEQSDERGSYPAGTVVINQPDTVHSVKSAAGCVVLIQWNRPVEILASN